MAKETPVTFNYLGSKPLPAVARPGQFQITEDGKMYLGLWNGTYILLTGVVSIGGTASNMFADGSASFSVQDGHLVLRKPVGGGTNPFFVRDGHLMLRKNVGEVNPFRIENGRLLMTLARG